MSQQQPLVLVNAPSQESASAPDSSVLRIESVTWNRDSHELFDYESRHVFGRKYLLRKPAKLFRSSLEVSVVTDGNEIPQNADYLLSVKAREGKFYIYPADRNVCGPSANIQPRKLWLIIKHLQRSSFPLNEGDVIKLGRFKLRVKQVVTETEGATPVDFKLDDVEVPPTELSVEDAPNMQCRICLLEGGELHDPLVRACQCKGSIMYVHLDCLRHWVNGRLNLAEDPARSCCFVKQIQCELCKSTFPSFVTARGVKLPVVKVPNVQPPFIVLENLVGPTNRGVHLCSMSVKKECKLGRGHESDVRIADVSISRFHAMIKYIDGSFFLEDHGSKFGTLVALRKATMVERVDKLSVQVGRTVLKFSMEDNVTRSFTECLDITDSSDMPNTPGASLELAAQEYADARGLPQGDANGNDSSMEGQPITQAQMNMVAMEAASRLVGLPPRGNIYTALPSEAQRPPNDPVNLTGLLHRSSQPAGLTQAAPEGPGISQDRGQLMSAAAARLVPFGMNINHLFHNTTAAYSPRMFDGNEQTHNPNTNIATGNAQLQAENRAEGWSPGLGVADVANPHVVGGSRSRSPQQTRPAAENEDLGEEGVRQSTFVTGHPQQRVLGQASGESANGVPPAAGDASMASRRAGEAAVGGGAQGGDASMRCEWTAGGSGLGNMVLRRSVWPAAYLIEAQQEVLPAESETEPRVSGVNEGDR